MATITGTPGPVINAFATVSADGLPIDQAESSVTAQQITNDIASIKAGAVTLSALKTFADGIAIAQTKAITANGTGATIAGVWEATGAWTFDSDVNFNKSPELSTGTPLFNVTGATNATPIVVTVVNHGLVDGQQAVIASVGGNTAANGTRVVNVLSASTFSLVGSAGNGAYTAATGTMRATVEIGFSAPRTVTRVLTNLWNDGNTWSDSAWSCDDGGVFSAVNGTPTTHVQHFGYELDVPHGANLVSATIYREPNTSHAAFPGGAPGTFPMVRLRRFTLSSGATDTIASQTDPNTSTKTAYETYAGITATVGGDEFVDRSLYRYMVILSTESGANALDGTRVFAGTVTFATSFLEQV